MVGVVPIALGLTIGQLITQKHIRLDLMRTREVMDGTVVELLSGIDYVRAANSHRREIGRVARAKIEALLETQVYLDLWVKVLPNWRRDQRALRRLGYQLPPDPDA